MALLFLIGPRGSGKSLAAGTLSKAYEWRSCDTDRMVVAAAGKSIAEIVKDEGWEAFRALEKAALFEAIALMGAEAEPPAVVATGGGIVLDPESRARMRQAGVVAYLQAPPELVIARLEKSLCDASRPPLSSLEFAEEIRTVMAERERLYREAAHHRVNAALPPEELARALRTLLTRKEKA